MNATRFAALAGALLLAACSSVPHAVPASADRAPKADEDTRFARHAEAVLEEMWEEFPESAFRVGRYEYADRMTVLDRARRERSVAFYDRQLAALGRFDAKRLSASNRVDLTLMRNEFESNRWDLLTFKSWQWQPSTYNVGGSFGRMLTTEYAPLDTRLRHVLARLEKVPAYYAAAEASIENPTLEHTQLALLQNKGALAGFGDDLLKKVDASGLGGDERALFRARLAAARAATEGYITFLSALESRLKKDGARSFRIGAELYGQKFAYDIQSGFTAEQLYRLALKEKDRLHTQMALRARQIWPKYLGTEPMPDDRLVLIRKAIDALSLHHTTREDFVETVRRQIPELEAFVRRKDLLTQDATRPLVVRETPLYMRGGAGASVNAPGPYDPQANTYYNVTPLDTFTDEQAESYLREYNDWMLQILNIHEAIPGHYTQFVHANKSRSAIKAIFGNDSMIEGWAVFSEKLMLDAGYGGDSPEMWLIWMKWNLRTVVNTLLDYQVHTQGMSREAAIEMLTREAFQQQTEAAEKWRRVTLSQVQLASYFNGYAEIRALQASERMRLGERFSVKTFNDRFLSYGNAPVRFIGELMLGAD